MSSNQRFPQEFKSLKQDIEQALLPIKRIGDSTEANKKFLFTAQRTAEGRKLPPYFLCYFLFVELLEYRNLGQFEKIAWSVPIDYKGVAFLIEHRKLGLGLFARDAKKQHNEARAIVRRISTAVEMATPYFEWRAQQAAGQSKLNVANHHRRLYGRFQYFVGSFRTAYEATEEGSAQDDLLESGDAVGSFTQLCDVRKHAEWLALAAMESFFSWSEHVFIHIAILNGKATTGEDIANLADSDWPTKFKSALDINQTETKWFYDQLITIRRQLRNYITHGAFGKRGEAFSFHSGAGAVPLLLPHQTGSGQFSFSGELAFNENEVIDLIEKFIDHLWSGRRRAAVIYIESELPLILTRAKDGTYRKFMKSTREMQEYVDYLTEEFDRAANMDW